MPQNRFRRSITLGVGIAASSPARGYTAPATLRKGRGGASYRPGSKITKKNAESVTLVDSSPI